MSLNGLVSEVKIDYRKENNNKYIASLRNGFQSGLELNMNIKNEQEREAVDYLLARGEIKLINFRKDKGGFYVDINDDSFDELNIKDIFLKMKNILTKILITPKNFTSKRF
jgi:hypothetical protein